MSLWGENRENQKDVYCTKSTIIPAMYGVPEIALVGWTIARSGCSRSAKVFISSCMVGVDVVSDRVWFNIYVPGEAVLGLS